MPAASLPPLPPFPPAAASSLCTLCDPAARMVQVRALVCAGRGSRALCGRPGRPAGQGARPGRRGGSRGGGRHVFGLLGHCPGASCACAGTARRGREGGGGRQAEGTGPCHAPCSPGLACCRCAPPRRLAGPPGCPDLQHECAGGRDAEQMVRLPHGPRASKQTRWRRTSLCFKLNQPLPCRSRPSITPQPHAKTPSTHAPTPAPRLARPPTHNPNPTAPRPGP